MASDLYATLEVSPQASAEEIRRAYYRMVRQYPPEREPQRFKEIRAAYETLSDARARQNYDALSTYGDEIGTLWEEAAHLMGERRWEQAMRPLKRILVLAPALDAARNSLGLCALHLGRWNEAARILRRLTDRAPEVAVYWLNRGHAYMGEAQSLSDKTGARAADLYARARSCFEQAISLDPIDDHAHRLIAETYLDQKQYQMALSWAERAVGADGRVDLQDFEALFLTCIIHLHSGNLGQVEVVGRRIRDLLPDEPETRAYAAARFAAVGGELIQAGASGAAATFLKLATEIDPADREIGERPSPPRRLNSSPCEMTLTWSKHCGGLSVSNWPG